MAFCAAVALTGSLLLTAARVFTPGDELFVMAASFVPYALVGYAVAAVMFVLARHGSVGEQRRWLGLSALMAAAGVLLHLGLLAPMYVGDHPDGPADLSVMTLNMRLGRADPARVVELAREADVLALEEFPPGAGIGLEKAGIAERFKYSSGAPAAGASGTVVLSRYPISADRRLDVSNGAYLMRIHAPTPFWLVAVHTTQPMKRLDVWKSDQRAIERTVADLSGPIVVMGDFNATLDHRPIRDLIGLGLHDAARQANSGWQPTWPWFPGIAIDHVLISKQFGAISTRTHRVTGTDHHALVVELKVRASAEG